MPAATAVRERDWDVHVARIVSGGQAGADRAALDAALEHGLPYAGWCPAGGWAEDRPDPPGVRLDYPRLRETRSGDPAERTRLNVRDSHATLVVRSHSVDSRGTDLTVATAERLGRPCLVTTDAESVLDWLSGLGRDLTLNVAGPRESERPGSYASTLDLLRRVLRADGG